MRVEGELRVSGFGFRKQGSGFRVSRSRFRVPGFGLRADSGFRVPGFGCKVQGAGCRAQGIGDSGVPWPGSWGAPRRRPRRSTAASSAVVQNTGI